MEIIETDSIYNFLKYNPFLYDRKYAQKSEEELSKIGKAYLKLIKKANIKTLETFKNLQNIYIKHKTLYSEKILNEMNSNFSIKQDILFGCGIGAFCYFLLSCIMFIPIYIILCDCGNNCPIANVNMNPWKNTLLFYLVYLPSVLLVLFSFIIVCIQKINYGIYSKKEYIKEYYNYKSYNYDEKENSYFEKGQYLNNVQFICLLLAIIIMAIHLILMYLIYGKRIYVNNSVINTTEISNINYNDNPGSADFAAYNSVQNVEQPINYQPPPPPQPINYQPPPRHFRIFNRS